MLEAAIGKDGAPITDYAGRDQDSGSRIAGGEPSDPFGGQFPIGWIEQLVQAIENYQCVPTRPQERLKLFGAERIALCFGKVGKELNECLGLAFGAHARISAQLNQQWQIPLQDSNYAVLVGLQK